MKFHFQATLYTLTAAFVFTAIVSTGSSCRKEYVDKINTIAGDTVYISGIDRIQLFEVREYSADTVLKAGITADSIIVYWPSASRKMPDSITPIIKLYDSATVQPLSGQKVAFKTGTSYTVTSAAGTSKKYTLKVVQQSAVPWFSLSSPSILLGNIIPLNGDQFWQDTSQTRVYFVSVENGTAYQAELVSVGITGLRVIVPLDVPTNGLYDIKVVNGAFTLYNATELRRNNISLVYPTSMSINTAGLPTTLARGATFTVRGALLTKVTAASLYKAPNYVPVEVISAGIDKVALKIPAGMPTDIYNRVRVTTSEGVNYTMTGLSITVTQ